jgi:hypothetical protein
MLDHLVVSVQLKRLELDVRTWHFTYGSEQAYPDGYTTYKGFDEEQARAIQFALHGREWSHSYPNDHFFKDMVRRYDMKCGETISRDSYEDEGRVWNGYEV